MAEREGFGQESFVFIVATAPQNIPSSGDDFMQAEEAGFEPAKGFYPLLDFESSAFNQLSHSSNTAIKTSIFWLV